MLRKPIWILVIFIVGLALAFFVSPPSHGGLTQASAANFEKLVLASEQPVLVDFAATWCGPCRRMEPVLTGLASDFAGEARVVQVDIDKDRQLADKYNVTSIPCLIVFDGGEEVKRFVGITKRDELAGALEALRE